MHAFRCPNCGATIWVEDRQPDYHTCHRCKKKVTPVDPKECAKCVLCGRRVPASTMREGHCDRCCGTCSECGTRKPLKAFSFVNDPVEGVRPSLQMTRNGRSRTCVDCQRAERDRQDQARVHAPTSTEEVDF